MIKMLYIGIIAIPFLIIPGFDTRLPKEVLSLGIALMIILYTLHKGQFKEFKNYWLFLFLGSVYVGILFAPQFKDFLLAYHHPVGSALPKTAKPGAISLLVNRDVSNLWQYKAFFYILVYSMMMMAVASYEFTRDQIDRVLSFMCWASFIMSLYVFLQYFKLDPFFSKISEMKNSDVNYLDRPLIGGFMGQATIVAPFIAMVIPIALYLRRYIWAGIMVIAVFMTVSKVAIVALMLGIIGYFLLSGRRFSKIFGIFLLVLCVGGTTFYIKHKMATTKIIYDVTKFKTFFMYESNGRGDTWVNAIKELGEPFEGRKRALLGNGAGSFKYSYSIRNNSKFHQLHSDPLEALYNFGILGVGLLIMTILYFIKGLLPKNRHYCMAGEFIVGLSMSLFIIGLCSFGTFPFQIAPTIFYTVVIIGLLNNEIAGGYYAN